MSIKRNTASLALLLVTLCWAQASSAAISVQGTQWQFHKIGESSVVDGSNPGLLLAHGTLSGSTGINQVTGKYSLHNGSLQVSDIGMTKMAGPPELMRQEMQILDALNKVKSYRVRNSRLELTAGDKVLATLTHTRAAAKHPKPAASAAALLAGNWVLAALNGDPYKANPTETAPYLRFTSQGRLLGHTGVNEMSGSYSIRGNLLTLGPIVATKRAGLRELNRLERDLLDVLRNEVKWSISGRSLSLSGELGTARFVRK